MINTITKKESRPARRNPNSIRSINTLHSITAVKQKSSFLSLAWQLLYGAALGVLFVLTIHAVGVVAGGV